MNGRHFVLLGLIACAGLLSVHEGQEQIELCYRIAATEKTLRVMHTGIEQCKIRYQSLQSPKAVMDRANELKLKVEPVALANKAAAAPPPIELTAPESDTHRSQGLGSAQGALHPVPAISHGHN